MYLRPGKTLDIEDNQLMYLRPGNTLDTEDNQLVKIGW